VGGGGGGGGYQGVGGGVKKLFLTLDPEDPTTDTPPEPKSYHYLPHTNGEMTLLLNYVCMVDTIHHFKVRNSPPNATLTNSAQLKGLYFDCTEKFELRVRS